MKTWLLIFACLAAAFARQAHAIELSLEENRAQMGSIGYVDMQRIFKTFPGTQRAKEAFEATVEQAEDQINEKKAAILRLRHKIAELKLEKDFAATPVVISTPSVVTPPPPVAAPAAAPAPAPLLPGLQPQVSTSAVVSGGVSTGTVLPGGVPAGALSTAAVSMAAVSVSSSAAATVGPVAPPAAIAFSTPAAAVSLPTPPAVAASSASTAALDAQIQGLSQQLDALEADYKKTEDVTEKDLLDLENRKTQVILGKIYAAIQAVAKDGKISVVVDKGSIIYGLDAVDMTQKVIDYLRSHQ